MAVFGPSDASWSSDVDGGGTKYVGDGSDYSGGDGVNNYRTAWKFDISSLPAGLTVTQVDLEVEVSSAATSIVHDVGCYGTNGQDDPAVDSGSTMYTRCIPGNTYLSGISTYQSTGTKTHTNLGSQANTDVQNAKGAGSIFSISVRDTTDSTGTNAAQFNEYNGANPPALTVTYTTGGGGSPTIQHHRRLLAQ